MSTRFNKFYVAFAGAAVSVGLKMVSSRFGVDLTGFEGDIVQGVTGFVTAYLVYLVPNATPEA